MASPRQAIPVTRFDFLNGSYQKNAKARLSTLIVIGVVLVAAMAVFIHGLNSNLKTSSMEAEVSSTLDLQIAKSQELTRAAFPGTTGFPEDTMLSHLEERQKIATEALAESIPLSAILSDVRNAAPAGTTISSITVGPEQKAEGTSSSDTSAAGGTSIVISSTTSNYQDIKTWQTNLGELNYLKVEEPTWVDSGEVITLQSNAKLVPGFMSDQHVSVATQLGIETVPVDAENETETAPTTEVTE